MKLQKLWVEVEQNIKLHTSQEETAGKLTSKHLSFIFAIPVSRSWTVQMNYELLNAQMIMTGTTVNGLTYCGVFGGNFFSEVLKQSLTNFQPLPNCIASSIFESHWSNMDTKIPHTTVPSGSIYGTFNTQSQKKDSALLRCCDCLAQLLWLIFGGGLIMLIFWGDKVAKFDVM